jgi:hypothetical protein
VASTRDFYSLSLASYTSPKARQVALGQIKPYMVWCQWPGVAYDVFNSVGMAGLVGCSTALGQQHDVVLLRRGAL